MKYELSRSVFEDYDEFEKDVVTNKAPPEFKYSWEKYKRSHHCLYKRRGVFKLDLEAMASPINCDKEDGGNQSLENKIAEVESGSLEQEPKVSEKAKKIQKFRTFFKKDGSQRKEE